MENNIINHIPSSPPLKQQPLYVRKRIRPGHGDGSVSIYPEYVDKVFLNDQLDLSPEIIIYVEKDFFRELSALQLLEKEFINDPIIDHYPFPKIISSDEENYSIRITNCGMNLLQYRKSKLDLLNGKRYLIDTINCIVNNLQNLTMSHHNIHHQNFCINNKGHLHLIDFETSRHTHHDPKKAERRKLKYLALYENYRKQFKEIIFRYVT